MAKVIFIHPKDKSTEFLKTIIAAFYEAGRVILIEPDLEWDAGVLEEHLQDVHSDGDIIIYLGHGRSDGLYGTPNEKGVKPILLSRDQAQLMFNKRKTVLFACDSNALLKRIGAGIVQFVGFGNMPTDWNEIYAERELGDYKYLSKLTNESLEKFKEILVSMIVSTRIAVFDDLNFSRAMYLILRMELNKAMLKVASDRTMPFEERVELFKIIQEAKSEIIYKD